MPKQKWIKKYQGQPLPWEIRGNQTLPGADVALIILAKDDIVDIAFIHHGHFLHLLSCNLIVLYQTPPEMEEQSVKHL